MNIHHLIGKKVIIVHICQAGVQTIFSGKLCRATDGMYYVFSYPAWLAFFMLLVGKKESVIRFPWHSVSSFEDNMICLIDLTEEQLEDELRRAGVEASQQDK